MKYKLFLLAVLTAICLLMNADALVAGQSKSTEPRIFAEGVVSTGHEFTLTFMPDGKEAYFTRGFPDKKISHVMRTQLLDGKWQTPVPVSFSTDQWSDLDPCVSPDGKRLYFVSTRPVPGSQESARNMDIWYSDRVADDWSEPHHLENVNSPGKEGSPTVSKSGMLCFFSDRNAAANVNSIYCSELRAGKYGEPVKMGNEINSGTSDTSPFLSPNGNVMLFYSTRPGGYGKADLYVSFKQNGKWSQAKNLGTIVNTAEFEYNPSVSPDGNTFYFGRGGNIYEVPLEELKSAGLTPEQFRNK